MIRGLIAIALATSAAVGLAGEFNAVLNVGDAAPVWNELPTADGKSSSLADWKDKQLVVVVFTCNSCPVAVDYEDRIIAFAKKYADRVGVAAINVGQGEEENLAAMQQRAQAKQFPFPYASDPSQKIGRAFGASATPEFFLLSPERKIVYMGALDDNPDPAQVKTRHLEAAVEAALAGKAPTTAETYAHGCRIRYARQRQP